MIQEPIQPTLSPPTPTPAPRSRRLSGLQIGVAVVIALLLAIPVVMAIAANAPSTAPLAAGASTAPSPASDHGAGPKGGPGGPKGGPGGPGGPGGHIMVRAKSGNQLSLATQDGWSRTITATGDTAITKGGQTIAIGDVKVGDEVHFRQTKNDDGSYTIVAIDVVVPHAGGEVTKVDGNDITVKQHDGSTKVITVNGSTAYKLGPAKASKSDVKVGSDIDASGEVSGTTFTAITVNIRPAHAGGEVTKVDGNDITVKAKDGSTRVITVTSSTVYKLGPADASKSDVKVGVDIDAQGTADGTKFTAVAVNIHPAHADGEVTAKTSSTITVKGRDGKTTTIHVDSKTDYKVPGKDSASLSDISVGDRVGAQGTLRSDGSLDAVAVHGAPPKPDKGPKDNKSSSSAAPG